LGKGLKGDHSTEGAQIVKKDFVSMGLSLKLTAQVAWMVQNHLLLSGAAFRQNPQSAQTWAELFRRGVKGRRIPKLALLTAIDIRATNPEAWNEWKEKLLFELASALQSPKASRLNELIERAAKKKIRIERRFVELLDPRVVESVPSGVLLDDLRALQANGKIGARGSARGGGQQPVGVDLAPLVVKTRSRETWVRFHAVKDRPGLFFHFVQALFSNGVQIQESYVQTDTEKGAYDWFRVKTSLSPAVLKKALLRSLSASGKSVIVPHVRFAVIEVTSSDEKSATISFRGRDQKGALLAAAQALYQAGFEILSAQVHTWGRQIEDVFTVRSPGDEELRVRVSRLNQALTG
jgi:[protein-PII] uridylyltransferase